MIKQAHISNVRTEPFDINKTVNFPPISDRWEDMMDQMVGEKSSTERATKEHMKERYDQTHASFKMKEESDKQKFMFYNLANEVLKKEAESLNLEDFVNATAKSLNSFMATDYLFYKNDLYVSILDGELNKELNEFTGQDMFRVIAEKCLKRIKGEVSVYKKWRTNLENLLLSNPILPEKDTQITEQDRSLTARTRRCKSEADRIKEQLYRVEKFIHQKDQDLKAMQSHLEDFKDSLGVIRGSFEKPNVDISAKVKLFPLYDRERLEKLLFNTKDEKDVMVTISQHMIEGMIIREIEERYKDSSLKNLVRCMQMIPNAIRFKHLSMGPSKIYTRFDLSCNEIRLKMPKEDQVIRLSELPVDLQSNHPYVKNFYQHILIESGQAQKFLKFIFHESKLTNLLITRESIHTFIRIFRSDETGSISIFKSKLGLNPDTRKYFKECSTYPTFILEHILDSMGSYMPFLFKAETKMNTDKYSSGKNKPILPTTKDILHNTVILDYWYGLLESGEKLDLFNDRLNQVFIKHISKQIEYMEFSSFVDKNQVYDIQQFASGLLRRNKGSNHSITLLSFLNSKDRIKVKPAFWVKQGLLFKTSQNRKEDNHIYVMLLDQMKHPQIEIWFSLILTNDPLAINYDLKKFTDCLVEMLDFKLENLQMEQKRAGMTLDSYVKLMILRGRSCCLRLMSYMNFYRSAQKTINLEFLNLCDQRMAPKEPFVSENVQSLRKDDFFKQSNKFDRAEYEGMRRIFDDELNVETVLYSNLVSRSL